jgi:hypothetical protein
MYIDVYWQAKGDPAFRKELGRLIEKISQAEKAAIKNPVARRVFREGLTELYRLCNFNAGFLVPHFFPTYPYTEPLSLQARPFSFSMFNMQIGGFTVMRASRQVGKSTTIGARQLVNAHVMPNYRSLYIVPHEEHRKTFANRLREMERAFAYKVDSPHHRQNLNYKEYPNGSIIELIRVLSTAAESRGKTTDELLFDEYQHFDMNLEPEVEQTQKASKIPSTIYAGTSLTVDTPLESRWLQSSQGSWFVRAGDGKRWVNMGDKEEALSTIRPEGVVCPYTSKLLNVRDGQYVHAQQDAMEQGYIGLHIPQLIIPDMVESPIEWNKIWRAYNEYDRPKFLQEVLGIPTMEGAREITLQDLKNMCCLPDNEEEAIRKTANRYYRYVVSGCDWGGSDYNPAEKTKVSYTVHVIIGLTSDDKIDILYMKQHSGMGYREVADHIVRDHKRFNANAIASDFGVGAAYNMLIREQLPADKHFILGYVGPKSAPLSAPQGYSWFNQFSLNRTESITELYSAIRQTSPRIRCFSWDRAENLLMDFMNLFRVPLENAASGAAEFKYRRHGSKPDDTLHALNFAFTLMRLLKGEPLLEDRGLMERLRAQLQGGGNGFGGGFAGAPGTYSG